MLTQMDHQWIVSLRKAGYMLRDIAEEVGCSQRSVQSVLAIHGVKYLRRKKKYDRAVVLDMWQRGLTQMQIGIELGCSAATVSELVREMKLPTRRPLWSVPEMVVTPEEDAASADSLALSPYVQRRIKELGLGMPA